MSVSAAQPCAALRTKKPACPMRSSAAHRRQSRRSLRANGRPGIRSASLRQRRANRPTQRRVRILSTAGGLQAINRKICKQARRKSRQQYRRRITRYRRSVSSAQAIEKRVFRQKRFVPRFSAERSAMLFKQLAKRREENSTRHATHKRKCGGSQSASYSAPLTGAAYRLSLNCVQMFWNLLSFSPKSMINS